MQKIKTMAFLENESVGTNVVMKGRLGYISYVFDRDFEHEITFGHICYIINRQFKSNTRTDV